MVKFLIVKNGHEEGVNRMIEIGKGMEVPLQNCIDRLPDCNENIEITFGTMTDEEHVENGIKSIMYGEGCSREEAIKILES